MFPTTTNNFNRYRHNNHTVNIHNQPTFNPIADMTLSNNSTLLNPLKNTNKPQPTLTNSLNKQIFTTLKNKEKEFVEEVNYYNNLNRHGVPQQVPEQMNETIGRSRSRMIRGDSYAQESGLDNSLHVNQNKSMGSGLVYNKKKEDFLDRFIARQNNWQGYYKNTDKLESLKCDKHPEFLTNSEFLPNNKENKVDYDPEAFNNMKKSKLLPNSVVIDRNYQKTEVDKEWSKNYSNVLNNQKVFKDVNYMDLNKYNKMTRQLDRPYVDNDEEPHVDPALKKTILGVYNQM